MVVLEGRESGMDTPSMVFLAKGAVKNSLNVRNTDNHNIDKFSKYDRILRQKLKKKLSASTCKIEDIIYTVGFVAKQHHPTLDNEVYMHY